MLTAAGFFIVGMSANAFANYKDLRIRPSEKHDVIPTWNSGERTLVTEVISRNPKAFHADGFRSLRHEGLGVDHEEWKKAKAAAA